MGLVLLSPRSCPTPPPPPRGASLLPLLAPSFRAPWTCPGRAARSSGHSCSQGGHGGGTEPGLSQEALLPTGHPDVGTLALLCSFLQKLGLGSSLDEPQPPGLRSSEEDLETTQGGHPGPTQWGGLPGPRLS